MAYYSPRREQQLRDLAAKKKDLAEIEEQLAEREEALAEAQDEVSSFEREYWRVVGARYVELDKIESKIIEIKAELERRHAPPPETPTVNKNEFKWEWKPPVTPAPPPLDPRLTPNLKKLYREVAKRIHPDLAIDEAERARRTQLMAEANRAYQDGDEAKLQSLLRTAGGIPQESEVIDVEAEVLRVSQRIAKALERLNVISDEIYQTQLGEMAQLQQRVIEAKLRKRDLLAEIARGIEEHIKESQRKLDDLQKQLSKVH